MPHRWPHTSPPEDLEALLRVATRTGATLSLRGDTARAIWRSLDQSDVGSILDIIPPLARFEVGIFAPGSVGEPAVDALEEIRRELPWAGFFGLRTARAKGAIDFRLVRLINEPRILIVPDARSLAAGIAAEPAERLLALARDEKGQVLIATSRRAGRLGVEWRDPPELRQVNARDALHDLIHLATEMQSERGTTPGIDDPSQVIASLSGTLDDAQQVRDSVNAEDPALQLALLRYLTRRPAETDALDPKAKNTLNELSSRFPETLVARMTTILTTDVPFRAIVLTGPDGTRAVKEVMSHTPLMARVESAPPWADVVEDARGEGLSISEPIVINAAAPDPCCRYRDFSGGIVEVVWSTGPRIAEQRLPMVFLADDGEFTFGSGYLSAPDAASLRLDYGLLGYLRGGAGRVDVAAVWKPQPPNKQPAPDDHGKATP